MTKKFLLPIQSVTDLITNSSSMIFVLKTEKTKDDILKLIEAHTSQNTEKNSFSGCGGCIEVKTVKEWFDVVYEYEGIYDHEHGFHYKKTDQFLLEEDLLPIFKSQITVNENEIDIDDNDLIIDIDRSMSYTIQEFIVNTLQAQLIDN